MSVVLCRNNNVVYVDFSKKWDQAAQAIVDSLSWTNQTYLEICASTLAEDDYWDLIKAIKDPEFYQTIDEDLQDLVDGYFDSSRNE